MGGFRDDLLDWATEEGAASKSVPALLDGYCRFLCRQGFTYKKTAAGVGERTQ